MLINLEELLPPPIMLAHVAAVEPRKQGVFLRLEAPPDVQGNLPEPQNSVSIDGALRSKR